MPSQLHEVLVAMLRDRQELARALAEWATGEPIPSDCELRTRDQSYSEINPAEYRADLVVELASQQEPGPRKILIFEVQLTRDEGKRLSWPAYQAVLRAQHACPTMVVVVAPHPAIARWCAAPIDLDGHGRCVMRPCVVGPDLIPVVTEPSVAARNPGLATLSAIAHGHSPHALDVGRAAFTAALTLDDREARLYVDIVLHHLDTLARKALEREMALKLKHEYEYQSSFIRNLIADGLAKGQALGEARGEARGEAKGEAKGKRDSLRLILQARGFTVDAVVQDRIDNTQVDELDGLLSRAATGEGPDTLFD